MQLPDCLDAECCSWQQVAKVKLLEQLSDGVNLQSDYPEASARLQGLYRSAGRGTSHHVELTSQA
jgi:hypothetical protein